MYQYVKKAMLLYINRKKKHFLVDFAFFINRKERKRTQSFALRAFLLCDLCGKS